jgi:hypothetical protein
MATLESKQVELQKLDAALAAVTPNPEFILGRVVKVMTLAAGAGGDETRATFVLGQVFEALYPVLETARLAAKRERLVGEIQALA